MNASIFLQMAYENKSNWTLGENKPNSNPIKPNFRKAQMHINSLITKDYRKKDDFAVRKNKPNSNPISERPKTNTNVFITKDYRKTTLSQPKKTNPIKPNFRKAKMNANAFSQEDYENKTAFKLEQNKTKQSQGIKRIRSIFRGFILAFLAQAPHINITTHIVDPKTRICPQIRKKPEKPQVSVLTMGMGIFSSFFFTAGM